MHHTEILRISSWFDPCLASAYSLCERFSASICLLLERGLHEDIGRSLYKQAAQARLPPRQCVAMAELSTAKNRLLMHFESACQTRIGRDLLDRERKYFQTYEIPPQRPCPADCSRCRY